MVSHPYLTRSLTRFFFTVLCWTRRTRILFGVQHFFLRTVWYPTRIWPVLSPAEPVFFCAFTFFKDGMVSHPYLTRSLTRFFFTVLCWTRRTRIFLACSTFFKDGMVSHPYLTRSLTRFFFHGSVVDPLNPFFFARAPLCLRTVWYRTCI